MDVAHILCTAQKAAVMELDPVEVYQLESEFSVYNFVKDIVNVEIVMNQTLGMERRSIIRKRIYESGCLWPVNVLVPEIGYRLVIRENANIASGVKE